MASPSQPQPVERRGRAQFIPREVDCLSVRSHWARRQFDSLPSYYPLDDFPLHEPPRTHGIPKPADVLCPPVSTPKA